MQNLRVFRMTSGAFLGLAAAVCWGCSSADSGPQTYPVSGSVTLKGVPVEGVAVSFIPDGGGESAVGVTDSSGNYTLTTRVKDDGAVAGSYRVTLAKYDTKEDDPANNTVHASYDIANEYPEGYQESEQGLAPPSKNVLPTKYANPDTTEFTAAVAERENDFDFDIQ